MQDSSLTGFMRCSAPFINFILNKYDLVNYFTLKSYFFRLISFMATFPIDIESVFVYTLTMKNSMVFLLILLLPVYAYCHPGKTDYRGGHKCWKNCSEWELEFKEYHLHDKDWKPIRLDKKDMTIEQIKPQQKIDKAPFEQMKTSTDAREKDHAIKITPDEAVNQHNHNTAVSEESILPLNIIFLLVLALLLLIVLIYIRKKKEKNRACKQNLL